MFAFLSNNVQQYTVLIRSHRVTRGEYCSHGSKSTTNINKCSSTSVLNSEKMIGVQHIRSYSDVGRRFTLYHNKTR